MPGCDFLLNLRHLKSEALVLGNGTPGSFDGEAEEGTMVGVEVWAVVEVLEGVPFEDLCFWFVGQSEVPVVRCFFRIWRLFALSCVGDVTDLEINREDGAS